MRLSLLTCLGFVATISIGAERAYPQSGGLAFLKLEPSAEALGSGSALTALSGDAFSGFVNPAGLAGSRPNAAGFSYTAWVGNVQLFNLGSRIQAGSTGAFGIAITSSSTSDIEAREQPGVPSGTFDAQFVSAGVSYARALGPLRAGVTVKYLSEEIYTESAGGYALDVGVQADLVPRTVWIGFAAQHLGEMNELNIERTELPKTYRAGVAVQPFTIRTADDDAAAVKTYFSVDLVHRPSEDVTTAQVGAWLFAFDIIWLRAGYLGDDQLRDYTAGLGLLYRSFRFDYAYLPFETGFGASGQALTIQYFW